MESKPKGAGESRYDDELLSANWNPVIDLLAWSCGKTLDDVSRNTGADMTESDIDAFLDRIIRLAPESGRSTERLASPLPAAALLFFHHVPI